MARSFNSYYSGSGMLANAFLPHGFGDAADRRARVIAASSRRLAPELLALLRAQNDALPPSDARRANLDALAERGTAVVVTGQQVGVFLGPLYTLYKAASAIAIARALTTETGVRCVPLFWLQTEDHDFAEIATSVNPTDSGALLRLTLEDDASLARRSIAHRTLGPGVSVLVDQLAVSLEGQPQASEVIDLLRAHYRPGVPLARAFANVLGAFFAEDGLLVLDPRDAVTAQLAAPVIRTAIAEAPRLEAALTERSRALAEAGFAEQIPLRPGSSLAFFHLGEAHGPRYRLSFQGDHFTLPNEESVSAAELLATLERDPLRFSTSALLRPIVQDTLLPTAVYVGGPAEVSYFAQVSALYTAFGMEPPLIAERAHFRLVPTRMRGLLRKLNLDATDLEQPREVLFRKFSPTTDLSAPGPEWLAELEQRLDAFAAQAPSIDPALANAVERTRGSVRHAFGQLTRRYQRTVLARDEHLTQRLTRLEGWLRPEGAPQERVHSFPAFAARVGLAELRRVILEATAPFQPKLKELDL